VGLRAGLEWCGKSRPTGIRSPDRRARRQSPKITYEYQILPHRVSSSLQLKKMTDYPLHIQ
jgi:hypothetical protein